MTTLLPGARVVFTHGLLSRPRSTARLATSAAATMTVGLEVFVHDVIAAMTTAPWSSSVWRPSARVTGVRLRARDNGTGSVLPPPGAGSESEEPGVTAGGSEAGKLSADDSSVRSWTLPSSA